MHLASDENSGGSTPLRHSKKSMLVSEALFWIFGSGALISGFLVISAKNPIHSVFFLVVAFANASILMLLLGVEFLSILFLIVYVGAIAILFLFVVMMLNIKSVEMADNATRYVPIGFIIGFIFLVEVYILVEGSIQSRPSDFILETANYGVLWYPSSGNITALGQVLYTEYYIWFLVASFILLVAMIGAIVLTLEHESVKRQDLFGQIATEYKKTINLNK